MSLDDGDDAATRRLCGSLGKLPCQTFKYLNALCRIFGSLRIVKSLLERSELTFIENRVKDRKQPGRGDPDDLRAEGMIKNLALPQNSWVHRAPT
jgi:hypothetical protein